MEPVSNHDLEKRLEAVFDVCDPQNLGFITVERFVDLASEHFGADAIDADELIQITQLLDPQQNGKIHFKDFCVGVRKIVEIQQNQFDYSAVVESEDISTEDIRARSRSLSHSPVSFKKKKTVDDDVKSVSGITDLRNDVVMQESSSTGTLIDVCNNDISMPTVQVQSPGCSIANLNMPDFKNHVDSGRPDSVAEHYEDFGEVETESNMTYSSSHSADQVGPFSRLNRSSSRSLKSDKYRNSRAGSDNNSRRSSMSDVDIFGDIDGSFHDLNEKVKHLEEQLTAITSSQSETDMRHVSLKTENQFLAGKVNHLEEQLKDVEIRSWEQRAAEQKRHIELMAKQEKAMVREVEQLRITTSNVQNECMQLKHDVDKYKVEIDRLRQEKQEMAYQLEDAKDAYEMLKVDYEALESKYNSQMADIDQERQVNGELLDELGKELEELRLYKIEIEQAERCRSPSFNEMPNRYTELSLEVKQLQAENKRLKESNEELQAHILNQTVTEGRKLLRGNSNAGPSIADEMGDMPREELLHALIETEEVNRKLRDYVDRIILTILEKNPSLLEVKSPTKTPS